MDGVIYREFQNLGRLALALVVAAVVLLVAGSLVDPPLGGWLIVSAIFLVFPALFLASVHRMNRIVLSPQRLQVGNETFHRSDFDLVFGVQPPLVLSPGEQADVESRWPTPEGHEVRIIGGSWGRRIGTAMIVLREAGGRGVVALFSRRPEVLDPLLTEWIETVPETDPDRP